MEEVEISVKELMVKVKREINKQLDRPITADDIQVIVYALKEIDGYETEDKE